MTLRFSLAILLLSTRAFASSPFHASVSFGNIPAGAQPVQVAFDAQGNVFIVSYVNDGFGKQRIRIDKNDANGNSLASFTFQDVDAGLVVGAAVDPSGNLVIAGSTPAADVYPEVLTLPKLAFVTRIDSQLTTILSTIKLGGSRGFTAAGALVLDQQGNIYVTGQTDDSGFPTTPGAFQPGPPQLEATYAFVTEIASDGTSILYSTLFGDPAVSCAAGSGLCPTSAFTHGSAIAVDGTGNVVVAGSTTANHLPITAGAFSAVCGDCSIPASGYEDSAGFIAKFSPGVSKLLASTYIPVVAASSYPTSVEITSLAVEGSGNIDAAGAASSVLPVTAGALQTEFPQSESQEAGFVLKLDSSAQHLLFATYFGGAAIPYQSSYGGVNAITEDAQGSIWLTGGSPADLLPAPPGTPPLGDTYLAAISADGSSLTAIFTAPPAVAGLAIAANVRGVTALGNSGGLLTASPGAAPSLIAVANAAGSTVSGAVAPIELISLYGIGFGSSSVQVFFDGAPAPILYSGPTQINAIVPSTVAGRASTSLQIVNSSGTVAGVTMQVSPSQPGVVLGLEQDPDSSLPYAAALNQDGTVNSASNPAAFGSVVSVWVSGAGLSTISVPDGTIRTPKELGAPTLPVAAFAAQELFTAFLGLPAAGPLSTEVTFAGDAPGMVSGVTQVNFLVPSVIQTGATSGVFFTAGYEFWLQIGAAQSEPFTLYLK